MNAAEREHYEEARFLAQPSTPRDERSRSSLGELEFSFQTLKGLCLRPKCVLREGHPGECWPKG